MTLFSLYAIGGVQSAIAMGSGFDPYFRLAQEKQDKIPVKDYIAWYERFWDAHKDQYIDFLTKEYAKQLKMLGDISSSPQEMAANAFERERNRYTLMQSIEPLTQAKLPAEIRSLIMYFPPSPFEQEFRSQFWRWLQDR